MMKGGSIVGELETLVITISFVIEQVEEITRHVPFNANGAEALPGPPQARDSPPFAKPVTPSRPEAEALLLFRLLRLLALLGRGPRAQSGGLSD
jgi:hypothetical protein